MPDPVDILLDEIELDIDAIRNTFVQTELTANASLQSCTQLLNAMYDPYNAVWHMSGAYHGLQVAALSRTHDTEWVISRSYARSTVQSILTPSPINKTENGISFSLNPIGSPAFNWASSVGEPLPAGRIGLVLRWRLETSVTADPEIIDHAIQIQPQLDGMVIKFVECTSSIFTNPSGDRIDIFWMLPVQYRRQARNDLFRTVSDLFSDLEISIPPLDVFGASPLPHTVALCSNQLEIAARALPKRRNPLPLAPRMWNGRDAGVRLKREIVEPVIKQQVEAQDVELVNLEFQNDYLITEVHRHEHQSECTIDVYVDVWISHQIAIVEREPGVLYADGSWISWRYEWESPNCFPLCDRVESETESRIEDAIESAKYFEIEFVDLSALCVRSMCLPEPYGLFFMLEL